MSKTFFVAWTILAIAPSAWVQNPTGSLAGCVSDTARQPLPGAKIQVSGADVERSALTETDGCFRLTALPPEKYTMVATLTGFSAVTRDELTVRNGQLTRVDFRMHVTPMDLCGCLTVFEPTVPSLWEEADLVAQIRITHHDYGPEDAIMGTVTHTATVLRVWKDTLKTGEVRDAVRFVQQQGERPDERYAVGRDFIVFLTANGPGPFDIAGAFAIENGHVHSTRVAGYDGKSADDLVAEIVALVGK
jgi:carboxypeptidase family protein